MPRYQVSIDFTGTWTEDVEAETVEAAVQFALLGYETASYSIAEAVESFHPTEEHVEVVEVYELPALPRGE